MSGKITVTLLENLQMKVTVSHHAWFADEPREDGGDDLGPTPFEMMLAALGSCTVVVLTQYAAKARIPVTGLWVEVEGKWLGKRFAVNEGYEIHRHIKARGDLDETSLQRLEKAADRCPVHQILEKGAKVITSIEKV